MEKYTPYCTCFYVKEEKKVYFYDEIKDRPLGKQKVKDKEEADHVMRIWQDNAPAGVICNILKQQ